MMSQVASGEEFKAGFGVDPTVLVEKSLVDKKEHIEGGNKVAEFEYKIVISNYGNEGVALRLEDRIPFNPSGAVQVKLIEAKPELSQDKEYQETQSRKGLLRWDLKVSANAVNDKAFIVTYKFSTAHDKQMAIQGAEIPAVK